MNMKRRQRRAGKVPEPPGRVRIVAGKWRGRFLTVADVPGLRPTPERIRETLFNWLAPRIEGSHCLDLFAGTGVLGLEALSRGAADVILVERSAAAVRALRNSIEALDAGHATIHEGDAWEFLRGRGEGSHDIVFLDPPYADERLGEACSLLAENGWLAANAVVYYEQLRGREPPVLPEGWNVLREKTAGNVRYCLLDAGGRR
jgi:16S rRNA (guanine966-N2)-methyltransferase